RRRSEDHVRPEHQHQARPRRPREPRLDGAGHPARLRRCRHGRLGDLQRRSLDLAATGLFFFFMQLISMMLKAGLIVVPEKNRKDFGETRGLLKTAWREFQEFQGRSPIWRMALL